MNAAKTPEPNVDIDVSDLKEAAKVAIARIPPKSFLSSTTIQGMALLDVLVLGDWVTGDPFSLNGVIKLAIILPGLAIANKRAYDGRANAVTPIEFKLSSNEAATQEMGEGERL